MYIKGVCGEVTIIPLFLPFVPSNCTNMEQIPVIDFGKFDSDPVAVAAAIREACESIGFFFLKNVGIPQAEIDGMFELVRISEPTKY